MSDPILLINAKLSSCRWPVDSDLDSMCCGQDTEGHKSYCPVHRKESYWPNQPRKSDFIRGLRKYCG